MFERKFFEMNEQWKEMRELFFPDLISSIVFGLIRKRRRDDSILNFSSPGKGSGILFPSGEKKERQARRR